MMVFNTGPDYLRAMSIPLLRGRFFTEDDLSDADGEGRTMGTDY